MICSRHRPGNYTRGTVYSSLDLYLQDNINQSILFRNNNKNTLYMYMSDQNKKVLLRGGHNAHNVPSSRDPKT